MIAKIGVIYQDANSLGLLKGLQSRLRCGAELIPPTAAVGRSSTMTRRQALLAWKQFQHAGVDLVLRYTDADAARWQDVRRNEIAVFPPEAQSVVVCGVATRNTEEWLALDPHYLAEQLHLDAAVLRDPEGRTDTIKAALTKLQGADQNKSQVVERIVVEAPSEVFRRWLLNDAFRIFYEECRAAAARAGCPVTNEL